MKILSPPPVSSARRLYLLRALVTLIDGGLPAARAYALVTREAGDERWLSADPVTECLLAAGRSDAAPGGGVELAVRRLEIEARVADTIRTTARRVGLLLLFAALAATSFFIWVMSQFREIFRQMNIELPAVTKALVALGELAETLGPAFAFPLTALALVAAGALLAHAAPYLPFLRGLFRRWRGARMRRDMGTLLAAGISTERTLDALARRARASGEKAEAACLASAIGYHLGCRPLSASLAYGHADAQLVHLVEAGEEAKALPRMLLVAAALEERRLFDSLSRIVIGMLPMTVLLCMLAAGFVVLALFMPMLRTCCCCG